MHAFDRQTDRRTDRILIARPRLHSMQRGKMIEDMSVAVGALPRDNVTVGLSGYACEPSAPSDLCIALLKL